MEAVRIYFVYSGILIKVQSVIKAPSYRIFYIFYNEQYFWK